MSAIVTEAILVTSGPVTALRRDRWWVIYSPLDWFGEYSEKIDELFGRIVPFPEGGRNSSRAEIVLTAFASSVVTASATRVQWIKKRDIASVDPTAAWVQQSQPLGRLVAFLWE
ncbi:hypothetical protein [Cystobacter fuscus]|uniref:hypothetical protein n=1 Tax=Cystobacter fuscus TaxID=43 RepID=UPI000BB3699E|nr:hypothetical protein [Cystobacter fuscus]